MVFFPVAGTWNIFMTGNVTLILKGTIYIQLIVSAKGDANWTSKTEVQKTLIQNVDNANLMCVYVQSS